MTRSHPAGCGTSSTSSEDGSGTVLLLLNLQLSFCVVVKNKYQKKNPQRLPSLACLWSVFPGWRLRFPLAVPTIDIFPS